MGYELILVLDTEEIKDSMEQVLGIREVTEEVPLALRSHLEFIEPRIEVKGAVEGDNVLVMTAHFKVAHDDQYALIIANALNRKLAGQGREGLGLSFRLLLQKAPDKN